MMNLQSTRHLGRARARGAAPTKSRPGRADHCVLRARTLAWLALLLPLVGCETTPVVGAETQAQVLAVPRVRAQLGGDHTSLHAAVRAGVTPAEVASQRLVRGECAVSDPARPGGANWFTVTTVLPPGMRLAPGTIVEVATVDEGAAAGAEPHQRRLHGRFVAVAPTLDETTGLRADPVRGRSGALKARCRPTGSAPDVIRIEVKGQVGWEYEFAATELARHDQFSDAELAAGRVLRVSCQLKVLDGGDWYTPVWLARAPAGLSLAEGDVVTLRAGAEEGSKVAGPLAQVIARADGGRDGAPARLARCR